jgi:hypothetical protein
MQTFYKLTDVIDEIKSLEHFKTLDCSCSFKVRYHTLSIGVSCSNCGAEYKVRAMGGVGTEIQDVIDAVLDWAGNGESFDAVLVRHQQIQKWETSD